MVNKKKSGSKKNVSNRGLVIGVAVAVLLLVVLGGGITGNVVGGSCEEGCFDNYVIDSGCSELDSCLSVCGNEEESEEGFFSAMFSFFAFGTEDDEGTEDFEDEFGADLPDGSSCVNSEDCFSGICDEGICGIGTEVGGEDESCTDDSDCTDTGLCVGGSCISCRSSIQCGPGNECKRGICGPRTDPPAPECTTDMDCVGNVIGEVCSSGGNCVQCTITEGCNVLGEYCVGYVCRPIWWD